MPDLFPNSNIPYHLHNGNDAPKIPASNITPGLRASGSIKFATTGTTYTLSLTGTPSQVLFYGNATHTTAGSIDIRAMLMGSACLGPSYFFQPVNTSGVGVSDSIGNVIQSGQAFVVANGATDIRTLATEGHIVTVNSGGSIVARATIPNIWTRADAGFAYTDKGYGEGYLHIDVFLASGWEINGNFVVT